MASSSCATPHRQYQQYQAHSLHCTYLPGIEQPLQPLATTHLVLGAEARPTRLRMPCAAPPTTSSMRSSRSALSDMASSMASLRVAGRAAGVPPVVINLVVAPSGPAAAAPGLVPPTRWTETTLWAPLGAPAAPRGDSRGEPLAAVVGADGWALGSYSRTPALMSLGGCKGEAGAGKKAWLRLCKKLNMCCAYGQCLQR